MQAVDRLAEWRASGLAEGLRISVNVSARQVREPAFAQETGGVCAVPPGR